MESYVLTCAYLLENADELLVALSMNLSKVDVLEIAVLILSVSEEKWEIDKCKVTFHAWLRKAHLSIS